MPRKGPSDVGASSAVARARAKSRSSTQTGSTPDTVTEPTAGSELGVEVDVSADIDGGPAAEDLIDVEGEVEEITMDVEETAASSDRGAQEIIWDEEQSPALRQVRKDAERTASVDSVRAYLNQIGKIALLNAQEEVELAKRIEAGLYAAERLHRAEDGTEQLRPGPAAHCA